MTTENEPRDSELQVELECFWEHIDEMMEAHEGKWVVIKGDEILGFFDSFETADKEGIKEYGATSFLVRQVKREHSFSAPAYAHGLIRK